VLLLASSRAFAYVTIGRLESPIVAALAWLHECRLQTRQSQ
jgi:hypothetical protein